MTDQNTKNDDLPVDLPLDAPLDAPLDPIAETILAALSASEAATPGKPISPEALAKAVAETRAKRDATGNLPADAWRKYFQATKNQALYLARIGRATVTRKGKPVPPEDLKSLSGIWRVRSPRPNDFNKEAELNN